MDEEMRMSENEQESQVVDGQEWTAERALADIVSAIDNPEDFGEQISVLTSAVQNGTSDEWRTRYENLRNEYRRRFVDSMEKSEYEFTEKPENNMRNITVDDLDFDGMTE